MRLAFVAFLLSSCGPSYRRQARADWVYDECRALDSDPYVHPDTKRRCWQYWLDEYDAHQSPRRIAYAEERVRQTTREANEPPPPEAEGGRESLPPGTPPPPDEPPIVSPGPGGQPPVVSPNPPGATARPCPSECHRLWSRCRDACGRRLSEGCGSTCNDVLAECIEDCD